MQVRKHTSEGSTLALKPGADVTRSPNQGYQCAHKKDLCPLKNIAILPEICTLFYISHSQ